MTDKVVIGDATLYHGDCMDVLPTLGKVDAVVTDVPYGISQCHNGLREIDYGDWDDKNIAYSALDAVPEFATLVAWCGSDQLSHLHDKFAGCSRRVLTWIKSNPTVMNGQHIFLPSTEHALYAKRKGVNAWFGGHCQPSYWRGGVEVGKWREHPTQKPLKLMEWLCSLVVPPSGDALDPFMGSGTTGVACMNLGRKFIGIELERKYFDIACERIEQAQRQVPLFGHDEPRDVYEQTQMDYA